MKKKMAAIAAVVMLGASMTGCSQAAKTYTKYVEAVLDATYKGDFTEYLNQVDTTKEEAQAVYEEGLEYMAEWIYGYYYVEADYISDTTRDGYLQLSKNIYSKLKYTVNDAEKAGDKYHVTVVMEPIDFWEITEDDVLAFYDEFMTEHEDAYSGAEELSDAEWTEIEEEYAVGILDILNSYVSKMGYKDPVNQIVEITFDDDGKYGVADSDWVTIDEALLSLNS